MKEQINVRQIPGESKRRWFYSEDFDLIVWVSDDNDFIGFELCYDKRRKERSIAWNNASGFRHMAVDDGEQSMGKHKASPILVADGVFSARNIYSTLLKVSPLLPKDVAIFVLQVLKRHPSFASSLK
jgi:hypothetical protein